MSEQRFRVWYRGKMIIKTLNDLLVDPINHFMFLDGGVMEFVGIHDGKDIWQGDIIQLTCERRHKQETSEVYYDERKACYGPFHHFIDDEDRWMDVDYEVEVIGNVWEMRNYAQKSGEI